MSKNLVTGDKNESVIACAKKMIDRKVSSILIVEATVGNKSAIVGMITKTDIIRRYPSLSRKKYKVSDFMASNVYTVVPSALLHEAMKIAYGKWEYVSSSGDRKEKTRRHNHY